MEEVWEAVNEMKSGKAPGLDGFPMKCLKKGYMAVLSPFCFLSIEFHSTFSISYKILPYFVYYYCIHTHPGVWMRSGKSSEIW